MTENFEVSKIIPAVSTENACQKNCPFLSPIDYDDILNDRSCDAMKCQFWHEACSTETEHRGYCDLVAGARGLSLIPVFLTALNLVVEKSIDKLKNGLHDDLLQLTGEIATVVDAQSATMERIGDRQTEQQKSRENQTDQLIEELNELNMKLQTIVDGVLHQLGILNINIGEGVLGALKSLSWK